MADPYRPSYTEYVGSILPQWPEFRHLYDFLSSPSASGQKDGEVVIIDQRHDGNINAQRFESTSRGLPVALSHKPSGVNARIVILQYQKAAEISRELVESVATRHHLSPLLLCNHFLGGDCGGSSYRPLRSFPQAFEFGFYRFLHASVLFLSSDSPEESESQDDAEDLTGM